MKKQSMTRVKRLPDGTVVQLLPEGERAPLADASDWARFDALTEREVTEAALADADNPPLGEDELTQLRPIPNPRAIRLRMNLTQAQFAERFHLSLGTLRDWEQGVREPDRAAKAYLRVIDKHPEAVLDALQ